MPVVVYTPESKLRTPGILLTSMWQDLKDSRELAWRLFVRDISARYRQSILGVFWAFLPPILTGLVFIILQSRKIVSFGETDIPYPVFALFGTTLWQLFTESLNSPMNSVRSARAMLAKINFPREALVVAAFYQMLYNLGIKLVILAGIFVYFGIQVTWGLMLAPLAILMLILLGMTLGLLLTPLGTLFTDVSSGLMFGIQLWFFVTPVVYPPPQAFPFSLIGTVNPVGPLLIGARDLATKGVLTNIEPFLIVSSLTLVGLFIAWLIYRTSLPIIIERMSA